MASIPLTIPTRGHDCSHEPRPDHRRRGSYPPLPPSLNPSPKPLTMASKLLNSNGSKSKEARKEAEAKMHNATTKSHQITTRSSGTLEWSCPPIFQVAVRMSSLERERFLLGARRLLEWPWGWCRQQFLRCASAKASPFRGRAQFFWLL